MSLVVDMMDRLEAVVRAAVPSLPAGATGATRGYVSAEDLTAEHFPHLVLWDPTERPTSLPYRQKRIEAGVRIFLYRHANTFAQSVDDWNAIKLAILAEPSLGALVDECDVTLEAIQEPGAEFDFRVTAIVATAFWEG